MATPQKTNCPGVLTKRWQVKTSWFFTWKLLELVVQFCEDMKQVLLSKASKAVWELLEYILIIHCDLTTRLKRGYTLFPSLEMVVLFDFSASQENYVEDKSESLCPMKIRKQCSFATQHVKENLRPENTGFKKKKHGWVNFLIWWSGRNPRWSPEDYPVKNSKKCGKGKKSPVRIWIFCCPAKVMGIKKNSKDVFQTPAFKQPDVKHDQASCAFELTHNKKVALTQQLVVMAVHLLLK